MKELDDDVTLRLVGDGENLEHCKQVARECGVENRVQFLGARADVAELVAESYIGIQSSNWEGFGLTAVEIMAVGKPIIATDVDGLKQVVEGAGLLFSVKDISTLVGHITMIMSDNDCYEKLTMASKQRAVQYDITVTANKYVETYKTVCNE